MTFVENSCLTTLKKPLTAYLAAPGFTAPLLMELRDRAKIIGIYERLILTEDLEPTTKVIHLPTPAWAQNIWYDATILNVSSINAAVRLLRQVQRNWWGYSFHLHRRSQLIQSQLPKIDTSPLTFAATPVADSAPLGSYCLLDATTLLYAAHCQSNFPHGELQFHECKNGPPSRAYLKLWEALTRAGHYPRPGQRCLELGASPGGWTWVVASLGATVTAVDRAPLAPNVAAMPGVCFQEGDAFAAKPDKIGEIDWLFSDVICYPEKLYQFIKLWLAAGACRNFVCTLKFQGTDHYRIIPEFAAIPGSQVVHLTYNKHELTWIHLQA